MLCCIGRGHVGWNQSHLPSEGGCLYNFRLQGGGLQNCSIGLEELFREKEFYFKATY
jgi:hypothetical protein